MQTVKCDSCGAPVSDRNKCEYCGGFFYEAVDDDETTESKAIYRIENGIATDFVLDRSMITEEHIKKFGAILAEHIKRTKM